MIEFSETIIYRALGAFINDPIHVRVHRFLPALSHPPVNLFIIVRIKKIFQVFDQL